MAVCPFGKISKRLFGFLHVVKCEFSGFHQVRQHQPGAPAEYGQQLINQTSLRILAGDDCLEDVGIADALGKAQGLFFPGDIRPSAQSCKQACQARERSPEPLERSKGLFARRPPALATLAWSAWVWGPRLERL